VIDLYGSWAAAVDDAFGGASMLGHESPLTYGRAPAVRPSVNDRSGRRERSCAVHSTSDVQPIAGQRGSADFDEREC
jgi:hypothetical protein